MSGQESGHDQRGSALPALSTAIDLYLAHNDELAPVAPTLAADPALRLHV